MRRFIRWDLAAGVAVLVLVGWSLWSQHERASWERSPQRVLDLARHECYMKLRQMSMLLEDHVQRHGRYPAELSEVMDRSPDWLKCPVAEVLEARSSGVSRGEYVYMVAGLRRTDIRLRAQFPVLYDAARNHPRGERTVVFANGAVRRVDAEEFRTLLLEAILAQSLAATATEP